MYTISGLGDAYFQVKGDIEVGDGFIRPKTRIG